MPSKPRPGERHIRAYLTYLKDPASAADEAAIRRARADIARAQDPIAAVLALSDLERAQGVDPKALEDAFIAHLGAFTEATGVTYNALVSVGVPPAVLDRAGIGQTAAPAPPRRSPPVNLDEVYEALDDKKPFTATEVGAAHGRAGHLAGDWLKRLVAEGRVERLGESPDWYGKGRPPLLYRKVIP